MNRNKRKWIYIILFSLAIIGFTSVIANAAPEKINLPNVNINVGGDGTSNDYVSNIKLLIFFTILSLLPSIVIMVTSFTRIVVVFSFLKSAIGATQSIPNQILTGLAIFLSVFIMMPVFIQMNDKAIKPYLENTITQEQAIEEGSKPLKEFMYKQTRKKDLELFIEIANLQDDQELTKENVPFYVVIPAFAISELKTAFQIGFLIYLPFLLIDIVVGSVLMAMGMFMLPPAMVSLPFKLLLFVMVDGWYLLTKSLIMSFG
ncbi:MULTISPECIES: flagellar type III secretion system pore protein FliP [Clostridium]|uniref:Flagellar biosynthetic protein FliP n=1 Tax=Clostridium cibarium TaxID=2762247 RepID=A0ABR8PNT4_9CLOT|nr:MULTISPECIES: flagellar type III secretion system pore protein FliP [Clostridium]MBD7909833.1 flagellar type III secretion system pore protein FliP [Clostridium cibarium]